MGCGDRQERQASGSQRHSGELYEGGEGRTEDSNMYEGRSEVGQAHCCIGKIDLHSKVRRLTGSFTADDSLDLDQTKAWKWYVQQNRTLEL